MKRSILLISTAIVAACASSPASLGRLAGQPVEFFAETADAPSEWAARGVAGVAPQGDWLSQFNDPLMVGLVNEALTNSPTLESRAALVRASEAATRIARSQRRPSVSGSVSAGVNSTSTTLGGTTNRNTDGVYGVGLDASWELDLWNRLGSGIGAAEADLAASQADYDAAELSLAAQTSIAWINLNAALAQERVAANLIASLVQPLFTGGQLDAQRDAAVAQAEAAVANYASTALDAWREVENALAADTYLAEQEDAQARALEEARLAEDLAERQYTSGTITIFNLIDAQTRRLTAESQLVTARASRATNRISYHLALGGGLPTGTASAQSAKSNSDTDAARSGRS